MEFEKFLIEVEEAGTGIMRSIYRFENGYGATVSAAVEGSDAIINGLFSMDMLEFPFEENNNFRRTYKEEMDDITIGWMAFEVVEGYLKQIKGFVK